MVKNLLFGMFAAAAAMPAFAFDKNTFVNTNEGRFQITEAQNLYTGNFTDFKGWTPISATEGAKLSDLFTSDDDATVGKFIKSQTNAVTEGMSYIYTPTDLSASFVVSMKIKGTAGADALPLSNTSTAYCDHQSQDANFRGANIITVEGINGEETVLLNSGVTIPDGWSTVAFGVVGDATYSAYKITIKSLNPEIAIADLQIQSAYKVADLRKRDAMLKYADAFAQTNPAAVTSDYTENYNAVKAIGDNSSESELEDVMASLDEILKTEIKASLDDQLTNDQSRCGLWATKIQKSNTWGEWTGYPEGRTHCSPVAREDGTTAEYPDFGHYSGYAGWGYDATGATPHGISMNIDLKPGKYVFVTNANGQARLAKKSTCWDSNTALDYVYGVMYALNANGDTIATTGNYGISPREYTQGVLAFEVKEEQTVEVGMKSYPYANNAGAMLGGALMLKDVEFYGKTVAEYTKLQETYYANVQAQVTAGRTALTTAAEYLANEDYKWGKAALKACVDTVEAKVAEYEKSVLDKKATIATMPEEYKSGVADEEISGMEASVYQNSARYILAANKEFLAENDTLASLGTALASAEKTRSLRIYELATGKDALDAEIAKAKALQKEMLAADYSLENADKIKAEIIALADESAVFVTTVPAENYTDIVDIDFSKDAVVADATAASTEGQGSAATIAGKLGELAITNFATVTPSDPKVYTYCPYEIGIDNNGAKDSLGILRLGNTVATVDVPAGSPKKPSDIMLVSFDFYYGALSGKDAGYYLLSEEKDTICGLICSKYSGTQTLNTFNVDYNANITAVGSSAASNAAIAAATNATHFNIILDYGRGSMYCVTSGAKGTFTTEEIAFDTAKKVAQFVLYSNYNNRDRRCWFDNLKIQNLAADETEKFGEVTGIAEIVPVFKAVKTTKAIENGKLVIKSAKGTFNAVGVQVK